MSMKFFWTRPNETWSKIMFLLGKCIIAVHRYIKIRKEQFILHYGPGEKKSRDRNIIFFLRIFNIQVPFSRKTLRLDDDMVRSRLRLVALVGDMTKRCADTVLFDRCTVCDKLHKQASNYVKLMSLDTYNFAIVIAILNQCGCQTMM